MRALQVSFKDAPMLGHNGGLVTFILNKDGPPVGRQHFSRRTDTRQHGFLPHAAEVVGQMHPFDATMLTRACAHANLRGFTTQIASKHVVKDRATQLIADVLAAYATEHLAHKVSKDHILYDIRKLNKWWAG